MQRVWKATAMTAVLVLGAGSRTVRAQFPTGPVLDAQTYFGCFTDPQFTNDCLTFTGTLQQYANSTEAAFTPSAKGGTIITSGGMLAPNLYLYLGDVQTNYAFLENRGANHWDFYDLGPMTAAFGATHDPQSILLTFQTATGCAPGEIAVIGSKCPNGLPFEFTGALSLNASVTTTPEPGALVLVATGLAFLGVFGLRAKRSFMS